MKKLLLIATLLSITPLQALFETDDEVAATKSASTHWCQCTGDPDRGRLSCDGVCENYGGWSGNAVLGGEGVRCICNQGKPRTVVRCGKMCKGMSNDWNKPQEIYSSNTGFVCGYKGKQPVDDIKGKEFSPTKDCYKPLR